MAKERFNCIVCGKKCEYNICDNCTNPIAEYIKYMCSDWDDNKCWELAQDKIRIEYCKRLLQDLKHEE